MINFIYGNSLFARRNKIIEMIARDSAEGKRVFLLVPEQFAVETERIMLKALPASAQLTLEVLNFSRLYNRVCRTFGGIRYNYITKPVRYAMMWKNLRELSPLLEIYGETAEKSASFCDIALAAIGEFKSSCIGASDLERAAKKMPEDSSLAKKLRDLALIYSSFDNFVAGTFSDSADDISKLSDILAEHDFFEGANVYIDAFTSFTAAEHRVIEKIFEGADNTSVSIPLSYPHENTLFTKSILDSEKRLLKSAKKYLEPTNIIAECEDTQNKNIKYLASTLFGTGKDKPENENAVFCTVASTPYTEAEAAARVALNLLREGYRCRDIVVIARDAEAYRGIIEPAFEKCALPYYFSEKTDLLGTPIVKFILSALRIKMYNFRTTDVISHLNTGLYDFDTRELDVFEQYVSMWQVKGELFKNGDFTMNPDGYVETMSERAKNMLDTANSVRKKLIESLWALFEALDKNPDVKEKCQAIYAFLVRSGAEKKLSELAEREYKRGNVREAEEYSKLFARVCDGLGELSSAMSHELSDSEISTDGLYELLTLFFSKSELGTIPTSADQIIIGSASTLRTSSPKCAIILGLCEGVFPATVADRGILSFSERSELADLGIELASNKDSAASDELMYLQRAVSTPSERLYLFTYSASLSGSRTTPSLPFTRATKLFPDNVRTYDSHDLLSDTPTLRASLPYLKQLKGTPLGEALFECALESEEFSRLLVSADIPVCDPECSIDPEKAKAIFGKTMKLSQSKLEKFIKCNFNYYCENVLKLREEKVTHFEANDIGSFVHYVLENLLSAIVTKDGINTEIGSDKLEELVNQIIELYISKISPPGMPVPARLAHLYRKLHNITIVLLSNILEEFKHSSFRPEFFELDTNGEEGNPSPREFELSDGTKVVFAGIIDRVDIFRSDDGKVYIRVVDYKTGTKKFSLEDIEYGLNIQMLLYLFTLINNQNPKFKEALGGDTVPAGVVYLSSNIPTINLGNFDPDSEIIKKAQKELDRNGILLDDEKILTAMNDELSPEFINGIKKRKKDGVLTGNALVSLEMFKELQGKIDSIITEIASEMRSGSAKIEPLVHKKNDPCTYCNMKPICRYTKRKETEEGDEDNEMY